MITLIVIGTWVFGILMVVSGWNSYTAFGRIIFPFIWPLILSLGAIVLLLVAIVVALGVVITAIGNLIWTDFGVHWHRWIS